MKEVGNFTGNQEERRELFVLAAYQLIAEQGFEHLRTRSVAALVGVNIATLHYYFATKELLIQGVVEYLIRQFSTQVPAWARKFGGVTPLDQIHAMFLGTFELFHGQPEMFVVLSELVLRSLRDASIQSALHRMDSEWQAYLSGLIAEGVRQGLFQDDIQPEVMAVRLIMLIKGYFFHQISDSEVPDFKHLLADVDRLLCAQDPGRS